MNRRGAIRAVLIPLIAALIVSIGAAGPAATTAHAAAVVEPPPPPVTVNDFIPEEQNLGDCLGALERPGCGSAARGGWRQTTVFVVMIAGLVVVFWRVAVGLRRNRSDISTTDR